MKVSEPSFSQIQAALEFFETRIRFEDDLPESPTPRLVGIRLRSTGRGLFEEAVIAFNENLNCLIGPRGSGKSTVMEALRYVLGQNRYLDEGRQAAGEEEAYARLARQVQGANLRDTEIELVYEHGDGLHVIAGTFDPEQQVARVYSLAGEDCHVDATALPTAYPVQIYSWGEIETLGRRAALQRALIDRLTEGMSELAHRRGDVRDTLSETASRIRSLRDQLDRDLRADGGQLRRYQEFKAAFERLNTEDVARLFRELDAGRERIDVLTAVLGQLEELESSVAAAIEDAGYTIGEEALADTTDETRAWWATRQAGLIGDLGEVVKRDLSHAAEAVRLRSRQVAQELEAQEEAALAKEAEIREQTQADARESVRRDQREEARRRFEAADRRRRAYLDRLEELEELLSTPSGGLERLATVTEAISDARAASAHALGERLAGLAQAELGVTIGLERLGDRSAVERYLDEDFLTRERAGHYHEQRTARRLAELGTPWSIARAIRDGDRSWLSGEGSAADGLRESEIDRLLADVEVRTHDEGADVPVIDPVLDELMALEEQQIDDLIRIRLNGRPVDELSPGQRSSAMLPLIALAERAPLIIDQPEDNLDNRMVGSTLTRVLAELKERRQIILATHNPNIVVGGDAEQVVVLDASGANRARVERTGSIDDDDVKDAVIAIMEGGRDAFLERRRRYGDRLET